MKYRTFGRTGLDVSEMVFGGGFVGGLLIYADDDAKRTAVRRALDCGVNWIDTAPLYGQGKSEEALGWILPEIGETPYLSTKVMLDTSRLDDIAGQIEASLSASLERLGRGSVDLVQLHNPIGRETGNGLLGVEQVQGAVADGLERLRAQGLTRFIGITALGETAACRTAIESGRFDSAQVYYNLLNPSAGRAMPAAWSGHDFGGLIGACAAHGVAVMIIRALAAGVLATDARHGREIVIAKDSEVELEEKRARAVFDALGSSWSTRAQTAIRFPLAHPDISCVVVGLAELGQIDELARGFESGPLPEEAMASLEGVWAAGFAPS